MRRLAFAFLRERPAAAGCTPRYKIDLPPLPSPSPPIMAPVKAKPSTAPNVAYNTDLRAPITIIVGEVPQAAVHAR